MGFSANRRKHWSISASIPTFQRGQFVQLLVVSCFCISLSILQNFSLDILQKFGGTFLSGLYKTGIEKVSYINLGYTYKKVNFGLQCFFPFIKDKYSNETIPGSIVYHKTDFHSKRKDHALALSISWNFSAGKKKASIRKKMENYDSDSGLFKIK